MLAFRRAYSRRWSARVERWRVRFWSLAAEAEAAESESMRRAREETTDSRCWRRSESADSVCDSSGVGLGGGSLV